MHLSTVAIVCSVRQHGEHGTIVRLLTEEAGLLAGFVRGGRSTRLRPALIPGNSVAADFRARNEEQLAALTIELHHSRGQLLNEPMAAAAIDWVTTLTSVALPEEQPFPALYVGLDGVLKVIELAQVASRWAAALVRYETLLLGQLGYRHGLSPTSDLRTAMSRNGTAISNHLLSGARAVGIAAMRDRLVDRLLRAVA